MKTWDFRNSTPDQINFFRRASALIAWNTLTPIFYQGPIAGEFIVYAATKLYLALDLKFSYNGSDIWVAAGGKVALHNIVNSTSSFLSNNVMIYQTAYRYLLNSVDANNVVFSRLDAAGYDNMVFNGYKIEQI